MPLELGLVNNAAVPLEQNVREFFYSWNLILGMLGLHALE